MNKNLMLTIKLYKKTKCVKPGGTNKILPSTVKVHLVKIPSFFKELQNLNSSFLN